jgi:hypothetical protein
MAIPPDGLLFDANEQGRDEATSVPGEFDGVAAFMGKNLSVDAMGCEVNYTAL